MDMDKIPTKIEAHDRYGMKTYYPLKGSDSGRIIMINQEDKQLLDDITARLESSGTPYIVMAVYTGRLSAELIYFVYVSR